MPPISPQTKVECQTPTEEYLIFTRGPIVPEPINYGTLEVLQALWSAQLRSCNLDKQAITDEFQKRD